MGELAFYESGMKKIARWSHLLESYKNEAESLVKMSKLTEVSIYQEPIGRQSVATCLRKFVFKEATPRIWWNILYNCATNSRKDEHIQGFCIFIN